MVLVTVNSALGFKSVRVGSSVGSTPVSGPSTVSLSIIVFPSSSTSVSDTSLTSSVPDGLSPVAVALFSIKPASKSAVVITFLTVTVALTPGAKLVIGLVPDKNVTSASVTSMLLIIVFPVLLTVIV